MLWGSLLAACSNDLTDPSRHVTLDLGTETGVLNFMYAVLQLELDFYSRVTNNMYPSMLTSEMDTFDQMRSNVDGARSAMVRTEIPSGRISDALLFRLGNVIDFADRTSVLTHAQTIEDAAARGFLAAASLVHTPATITTVQGLANDAADRSSTIRALANAGPLAITPLQPAEVIATLTPYYYTTFTVRP